MSETPAPKTQKTKLSSGWKLFRASVAELNANLWRYLLIVGVVTVPVNLLLIAPSFQTDAMQVYFSVFSVIMNLALIWAVVQRSRTGKAPSLRAAYYRGTAQLIRFVFVTLALVLMLLPAALGAALYQSALSNTDQTGAAPGELALLAVVSFILALPSIYLMVRYSLAIIGVVKYEEPNPVAVLRRTRALTKKRFWAVTGRFAALVVFIALLSLPASIVAWAISLLHLPDLGIAVFDIVVTLLALPIGNIYLLRLYNELERESA